MRIARCRRRRRSNLPLDWLDRKLGRAVPATEVREILESLEFRVDEGAARTFPGHSAELARHQRHHHQGRSGGRSRPHDRLRFHHAGGAAGAGARAARQSRARIPSSRARDGRRPGIHRGLQLFLHQRGAGARVRTSDGRRSRESDRQRSEPAARQPAARNSAKTSATTASTSIHSACSKSAARFTRIAKCRISPRRFTRKTTASPGCWS